MTLINIRLHGEEPLERLSTQWLATYRYYLQRIYYNKDIYLGGIERDELLYIHYINNEIEFRLNYKHYIDTVSPCPCCGAYPTQAGEHIRCIQCGLMSMELPLDPFANVELRCPCCGACPTQLGDHIRCIQCGLMSMTLHRDPFANVDYCMSDYDEQVYSWNDYVTNLANNLDRYTDELDRLEYVRVLLNIQSKYKRG